MSNLPGTVLLFLLFAAAILFVVFINYRGHRPRGLLLASLAGRWNGRVIEGGILTGDRLELRVDEVRGEVTFGEREIGSGAGGWTRVHFAWPSDWRLRVTPEVFSSRIRRLFGGSDIEFDDPPFDDRYWVESSHPTWARGLLDSATRRAFVMLARSPQGPYIDDLILDVGTAGVTLRMSRVVVDDAGTLGSFIEVCVSILQKARGFADAAGVTVEAVHVRAGSACPVCGNAVADAPFPCTSCRTPHHRECWSYFGGCAIFGCRTRMR